MAFIPHSDIDEARMLAALSLQQLDDLFQHIPASLRCDLLQALPEACNEMQLRQWFEERFNDHRLLNFMGAGAYEHHIPAAVWDIAGRGEFLTSYTPYQAEASQGTLQLLYEFQTMLCELTGMACSNASLYDGAHALAEAILMTVRMQKMTTGCCVLLPDTLHSHTRAAVQTLVGPRDITLQSVAYHPSTGLIDVAACEASLQELKQPVAALVIPQPNFFGGLEAVDELADLAHRFNAQVIAYVNPTSLALLKPPSNWGEAGADIVCGDGQPLGIPLACGGPYFGFLTCGKNAIRQLPGRLVGRTVDCNGKTGFTLTLQAREQHIRRGKATSNVCTNQGLLVTAATIYLSLLGAEGLAAVAAQSHANTQALSATLTSLPGVTRRFKSNFFHEIVLDFGVHADAIAQFLLERNMVLGYALGRDDAELDGCYLLCATETKTEAHIQQLYQAVQQAQQHVTS